MSCNYNCTTRDAIPPIRAGRGPGPSPAAPRTPMMPPSGQRGWNPRSASPSYFVGQPQNTQGTWQGRTPTKPQQSMGQQNQTLGYSRGYNFPAAMGACEESADSGYVSASYSPNRGASWCPSPSSQPYSSAATCVSTYSTPPYSPRTPYSSPPRAYQSPPPAYASPVRRPPASSPGYGAYQPAARATPYGNQAAAGARMPVNAWGAAAGGPCRVGNFAQQGMRSPHRSPARAPGPLPRGPQHPQPHRGENVTFAESTEQSYQHPSPQRGQAAPKQQLHATPSHLVSRLPEGPEGAINLEVTLLSPDSPVTESFTSDSFCPDSFTPESFCPDSFTPDTLCPDSYTTDAVCTVTFTPEPVAQDSFTPSAPSPSSKEGDARFLVSLKPRAQTEAPHATTTPLSTPAKTASCPGEPYAVPTPALCPATPPAARREDVPLEVRALFSGVADVLAQPDAGAAYRQPVRLRGVVTPARSSHSAHAPTVQKSNMPVQASAQIPDSLIPPVGSAVSDASPVQDVVTEGPASMRQSSEAQQAPTPPPRSSPPSPSPAGSANCHCPSDSKPPQAPNPVSQSSGGHLTAIRRLDTPAGPVWSAAVSADGAAYDVMATLAAADAAPGVA